MCQTGVVAHLFQVQAFVGRPWGFSVSMAVTGIRSVDNSAGWGEDELSDVVM